MKINLRNLPFSRYGSYLALSILSGSEKGSDGLFLRDVGGGDQDEGRLLKITPIDGKGCSVDSQVDADERELRINCPSVSGCIGICLPDEKSLLLRSEDLAFRFDFVSDQYECLNALGRDEWEFHSLSQEVKLRMKLLNGQFSEEGKMRLCFHGPLVEIHISRYLCVPYNSSVTLSYREALAEVSRDYNAYRKRTPSCASSYQSSRELASYITWSSVVHPSGRLSRPAMYMSKNQMNNIWSWDNCFNALGLASFNPELAFDQFIIFADLQDDSGVLPDFANNLYCSYTFCKPPIHGWAYMRLMEISPFFSETERVEQVYPMLKALEEYWRIHRKIQGWDLPYYNHGNDSGWDNATVFDGKGIISSPDLPTYLILLYESLEVTARRLSRNDEAEHWTELAQQMTSLMIKILWDGRRFRSWNVVVQHHVKAEHCLIDYIPILAARRFPDEIRRQLIKVLLSDRFRSSYGFATEALESPYFQRDSYWRGPIWAPVSLLIADGLSSCGEEDAAKALARDFCEATLIGGMAENFDAKSGIGYRDPAFTWTSNVFFYFTEHYLKENF